MACRAQFNWLRAIAALGLQWRKVTVCLKFIGARQGRASEARQEANAWTSKGNARAREGPNVGPWKRQGFLDSLGFPVDTKQQLGPLLKVFFNF